MNTKKEHLIRGDILLNYGMLEVVKVTKIQDLCFIVPQMVYMHFIVIDIVLCLYFILKPLIVIESDNCKYMFFTTRYNTGS